MEVKASRLKLNGVNLRVRDDYKDRLLEIGFPDIDSLILAPGAKIINDSRYRTVFSLPSGNSRRFFVKNHKYPELIDRLGYIFRLSRGRKEWKVGNLMLEGSVRTALPVAVGERRRWRILKKDFLITEAIEGSLTLDKFIEANFIRPLSGEKIRKKRALIKDLAGQMQGMHARGIFHYDFHAGNILVRMNGESPASFIMDLHRISLGGRVSLKKRLFNLGQLNGSLVKKVRLIDRLRFLKAYCGVRSLKQIRPLLPGIKRATEKIMKRAMKKHLRRHSEGPAHGPANGVKR